jgi:uncharacterized protein involved in cysteine biosynthesis
MITALTLAFDDLRIARVRGVLWHVVGWTLLIFVVVGGLIGWGVSSLDAERWVSDDPGFFGGLINALVWLLTGVGLVLLMWLAFAAIAQNVAAFYLERIIAAIEARRYPGLEPAKGSSIATDVSAMLRFTGALILWNVVAIPFYFIPVVNIVVFYVLNGYLFGREYAEAVTFRRLPPDEVKTWRRHHRGELLVAGALITLAMSVPVVNLAAPVLAASFVTHIYHKAEGRRASGLTP